ncbi:hypothetical protein FB45DRAFT_1079260 [Roridomyces roridus]|uniref:Uncharacterized protein n=1 Tax=Roridomyces roridus TaxID=1738132 RepID=A0AAD7FZZ1_9AGAR|nr:hypothetical protein FB45DRAFT_1079260 [Roridomyces roridus]
MSTNPPSSISKIFPRPPSPSIRFFVYLTPHDPNPVPPPGAVSETFVTGTSTVIVPVPSTTTAVVIATATITLAPGGTPVNGPVPSGISQPGATTPTWNPNIVPPTSVSSVTFTSPPSYTTVVAVPTASNSPPKNITGPPGDTNSNGDDWWLLVFPGIIGGLLPPDIGIPGGTTPTAAPPADWTGSWVDPDPTSTSTASQSSTSGAACSQPTAGYSLPDDPENADWEDEGTDPDRKKRGVNNEFNPVVRSSLERRADPRSIGVNVCSIVLVNSVSVSLVAGQYWSIGTKLPIGTGSRLSVTQVNSRPVGNGANTVAQEHIFELGYINQFFQVARTAGVSCDWIQANVFSFTRRDGSNLGVALLNAIDTASRLVANMVWVDTPLNQAKSNVVNQNKASPNSPPQSNSIDAIIDFKTSLNQIQNIEYFIRNFGALGAYFGNTAAIFQATALRVQNLLAEITPDTPDANLPVEFNAWLRSLVATYPDGCTSRATNTYNYYVAKMNTIKTSANPVPDCDLPLYNAGIAPQSFTFGNLIPPAPTLPACDVPGTQGNIILGQDSQGNDVVEAGVFRTMGSGNGQFYALGSGTSLAGIHWVAQDLSAVYPNCGGAFQIQLQDPSANFPDANIALNCNGQSGNNIRAPFNFVFNNQILQCLLLNHNDGTSQFDTICASSTAAAGTCGNSAIQAQAGTFPLATLSTTNYAFRPM